MYVFLCKVTFLITCQYSPYKLWVIYRHNCSSINDDSSVHVEHKNAVLRNKLALHLIFANLYYEVIDNTLGQTIMLKNGGGGNFS